MYKKYKKGVHEREWMIQKESEEKSRFLIK